MTGDRGLAGAFNSQIVRAAIRAAAEHEGEAARWPGTPPGRRGVSSLTFRGREVVGAYTGFTDRPAYGDARDIASDLMPPTSTARSTGSRSSTTSYISPLTQKVTRETLLPLQQATILEGDGRGSRAGDDEEEATGAKHALVEYEPDPEEILQRLIPPTWRSRSSGRCSSPPPPSTARA